jgi:membrane protein
MTVRDFGAALKDAAISWYNHNAFRFGASLAFYTVVSLAPLVLITVSILGLVYDQNSARQQLEGQVHEMVGEQGGRAVSLVLRNAPQRHATGIICTILGIIAFLGGFTGVFFELQSALNILWEIPPGPNQSFRASLKKMVFSLAVMGVIGFLLLVSLIVSAGLSAMDEYLNSWQPGFVLLWQAVNFLVTLAVITLLFALIFKYLPDAYIAWSDVWIGAFSTAVLFSIGRFAISEYLGHSGVASSYGAAGSIIVLLLWVYYSALILLFGAELTRVYANRFGAKVVPLSTSAEVATSSTDGNGAAERKQEHATTE